MNTLRQMKNSEEGFTLIELMIVLVVLGILTGLILFAVGPFQTAADQKVDTANLDTEQTCDAARLAGVTGDLTVRGDC